MSLISHETQLIYCIHILQYILFIQQIFEVKFIS